MHNKKMNAIRHESTKTLPPPDECTEPANSQVTDFLIGVARRICPFLREKPIELQQAHHRVVRRLTQTTSGQGVDALPISRLAFADTLPMEFTGSCMTSKDFLDGVEVTTFGVEKTNFGWQDDSVGKRTQINCDAGVNNIKNEREQYD
jgi:hypothetical protein